MTNDGQIKSIMSNLRKIKFWIRKYLLEAVLVKYMSAFGLLRRGHVLVADRADVLVLSQLLSCRVLQH